MDHRTSRDETPGVARRTRRWLAWGVVAVLVTFTPLPVRSRDAGDRLIRVEASSEGFVPGAIDVNLGDRVTLELVATDVVHGLYIEGYDVWLEADPGRTASTSFTANREGTFSFRCSIACGPLHPFLVGKLRVGNNLLFWRAIGLSILITVAAMGTRRG